jgi:hypothetical protein
VDHLPPQFAPLTHHELAAAQRFLRAHSGPDGPECDKVNRLPPLGPSTEVL